MGALLHHPALVQHHDARGVAHGVQPVGDDHHGTAFHQAAGAGRQWGLGLGGEGRGGRVEDPPGGGLEEGAGQGHALRLAAAEAGTGLPHGGAQPLGQGVHEVVQMGGLQGTVKFEPSTGTGRRRPQAAIRVAISAE